jgi:tRNA(fMet)-specific endonuclease VapC
MAGTRLLLDTNAAIGMLNRSPAIRPPLSASESVSLPLGALGELEFGARNSANVQRNLDAIEDLLKEIPLVAPDRRTAAIYGEIESALRRKGRPIPSNDIWIAAQAMQHDFEVLTRDKHFREVEGIAVCMW